MDDNTRAVLVLAVTSGTTIAVAWMRSKNDRKWYELVARRNGKEPPPPPPSPGGDPV